MVIMVVVWLVVVVASRSVSVWLVACVVSALVCWVVSRSIERRSNERTFIMAGVGADGVCMLSGCCWNSLACGVAVAGNILSCGVAVAG